MNKKCTDKLERDRLILFLNKLILHKVIHENNFNKTTFLSFFWSHFFNIICFVEKCEGYDGF